MTQCRSDTSPGAKLDLLQPGQSVHRVHADDRLPARVERSEFALFFRCRVVEGEVLLDIAVEHPEVRADSEEQGYVRVRLADQVEGIPLPLDCDVHHVEAGLERIAHGK